MLRFSEGSFVGIFAMAIPIVAIVGGITVAVVRTLGQQRVAELAHRERIAALERGVDPSKLPPPPVLDYGPAYGIYDPVRRYHGLLIGGIVCLVVGVAIGAFVSLMHTETNAWAVGLIPAGVGIALLLSANLIRPRSGSGTGTGTGGGGGPTPPKPY